MKIFLDGEESTFSYFENITVAEIIEKLGLQLGHLAIRINKEYISHKEIGTRIISPDDSIELINMYGGG